MSVVSQTYGQLIFFEKRLEKVFDSCETRIRNQKNFFLILEAVELSRAAEKITPLQYPF